MSTATQAAPMTMEQYLAAPGLSNHGMGLLAVSPLAYWHNIINPNRPPDRETPEMTLGTALHCAVLEPERFEDCYAGQLQPPEGCLRTIGEMRDWLGAQGIKAKGTLKADIIAQVQAVSDRVPILDVLETQHGELHKGKTILSLDDWGRVNAMARALRSEPRLESILEQGQAEASLFAAHEPTGVTLKARLDWMAPKANLDLKTFSARRGKSIDRCIGDAIVYEKYYRQAYVHSLVRALATNQNPLPVVMAFIQSEEPYEVRLKEFRAFDGRMENVWHSTARIEVRDLIDIYRESFERFGDGPWRAQQEIEPVTEEDVKQMAW